ncbi:MAG: RHS repeat-associated core domain-containing protein [Verrucomicrobiota bacterium]
MTTTRQYDLLNRLLSISSVGAAGGQGGASSESPTSHTYQYNEANQRTRATLADGSFWIYTYDALGQVTSGKKYWPDGTPVAGQQFEYAFDDIGNRTSTKAGGDENGGNLRSASYTGNNLNQYSGRGVPNAVDILGIADAAATVSVNSSSSGVYRRGQYFRRELTIDNSQNAQWQSVSVTTSGGGTNPPGNVFLPKTPETLGYDLDGNMTGDGRWTMIWDAENRLIQMVPLTNAPANSKRRLTFAYDHQGRRISKLVEVWTNSAWLVTSNLKFVYDRWNLLAELNATNKNVINSFMWGLDLSGSEHQSGGVGGLVAFKGTSQGTTHVPAYDGNGNVMALVDASTGNNSAKYDYGPFGEALNATGAAASVYMLRYSSRYEDLKTEHIYFGFRYLHVSSGSWTSRDPKGEQGGFRLTNFCNNDPINAIDPHGLDVQWKASGILSDSVWWWYFGVHFQEEVCKLTLQLDFDLNGTGKEQAKRLGPSWSEQIQNHWYGGWKLISRGPSNNCKCALGIDIDFEFTFGSGEGETRSLTVKKGHGKSNAETWLLDDEHANTKRFTAPPYSGVAHEIGHHLGLEDEYPDPRYPKRDIPDWEVSIMGCTECGKVLERHVWQIAITNAKVDDHLPSPPYAVIKK